MMYSPAGCVAEKKTESLPVTWKRLLLVDDDAPTRDGLNKALHEWSFATATAATLAEAHRVVLTEESFAIIVCDYRLPDGDGLEFLDWLRREQRLHVPFLLISGGVIPGPPPGENYEFLAKPFAMEEFHTVLLELERAG